MAKVGRPKTAKGTAAAKHRVAAQKEYANLPPSGKKARVANRSKAAQQKADNKRSSQPGRIAYKKQDAKAKVGIPKGSRCAVCGTTQNVQRHVVNGKFVKYLCGKHNVAAIGKG